MKLYIVVLDLSDITDAQPNLGVYSSKEKAEEAIEYFRKKNLDFWHIRNRYSIEEFELDRYEGY